MRRVTVVGGGPAGSAAALAALREGSQVRLFEPSRFPRHKVCGEFLSPGFAQAADDLGVWSRLEAAGAAPIRRALVVVKDAGLRHRLRAPAYGLSRYALDHVLLEAARQRGAQIIAGRGRAHVMDGGPVVHAAGRRRETRDDRGRRLFGFKAHFRGPADDAVELYFFRGCYVGVSPVERGGTNVCGLAPKALLDEYGFDFDELVWACEPLRRRVEPLTREWDWLTTGPVVTGWNGASPDGGVYPAGDSLGFVDPFTGAGLTNALITGRLAGAAAAHGEPVSRYVARCRQATGRVFRAAAALRWLIETGWAPRLAWMAPASLLFAATRPRV